MLINKLNSIKITVSILLLTVIFSCNKTQKEVPIPFDNSLSASLQHIPEGFPKVVHPEGNEFTLARWKLGKKLFYDPILSKDSTISCATCHKTELAFADNTPFSDGFEGRAGVSNSPSLANVAYNPYQLRGGSVPTLEMQILVPIQESNEFAHNIVDITEQLLKNPNYAQMSIDAYDREIDPFVITRSIALFERTLISGNSRYDQHVNQNKNELTTDEIAGMELFFSDKTNCASCHSDFNFTNYSFQNNGLYLDYENIGRMRLTGDTTDLSKFKVPSIRNIALTAPYMNDGSINTLEAVIEHYNSGGVNHINKSELIKPLGLTDREKEILIMFLKTLTDKEFINNAYLSN